MSEIVEVIMQLSVLVFVITSMLAMGLSLTVAQIIEPLRNTRLVVLALAANFVLVPILAYLILAIFSLDQGLETGLILVATAAGVSFLPKLAQVANQQVHFINIIAKLGRRQAHLPYLFTSLALPVGIQSLQEFIHGQPFLVEHQLLEGYQGIPCVDNRPISNNVLKVFITPIPRQHILPLFHTASHKTGEERQAQVPVSQPTRNVRQPPRAL